MSTHNLPTWSDKLMDAMMNAERLDAGKLIDQAFASGICMKSILTDILDPALRHLGQLWETQMVSLEQGFVAAKIAEDVLLRCLPTGAVTSAIPLKGAVVVGNIEDDYHSLGRRMVVSFTRAAGWEVYDLGNDVPAEEFVDKAVEVGAFVVGASAMMQTTALNIRKLRDLIDARGLRGRLKLAVGGAVFNWRPELVAEVGADGTTANCATASDLFERLQAQAKGEPVP